ncbi:MAG: hypothetical protein V3S78_06290, partial [Hyphomicrobium sp.]
ISNSSRLMGVPMGTSTERRSLIGFSSIFGRLFHATTNPARYDVDGTRCSFGSAALLAIIVRDAPVLRLDAVQVILRRLVAKAAASRLSVSGHCQRSSRFWAAFADLGRVGLTNF